MISHYYRLQNYQMHKEGSYGGNGFKWVPIIEKLINEYNVESLVNYGAGQTTLRRYLPDISVQEYDPCIPTLSKEPTPAHMLVMTDVAEHIEPEYLEEVLWHVSSLTQKIALISIALRPSNKLLPDGRNAHLIIESQDFWMDRLRDKFHKFREIKPIREGEFAILGINSDI